MLGSTDTDSSAAVSRSMMTPTSGMPLEAAGATQAGFVGLVLPVTAPEVVRLVVAGVGVEAAVPFPTQTT